MIEIINLSKSYGKRKILDSISLNFEKGQIIAILGPNGSGKTTAFYAISGIIEEDSGDLFIDGEKINKLPINIKSKLGIGYLPQESSIFRNMTAIENIKVAIEIKEKDQRKINELAEQMIKEFSLTNVANTKSYLLSGGEKRRVEMARLLATNPKYILLDEPFAGVDPVSIQEIGEILQKIKAKNIGIIVTDHNVLEALKIIDKGYVLFGGKIICHGTAEEIKSNELVRKVYLGNAF